MARTQRPYRKAHIPNTRVAGTSITASVPSAEQRARRALIDAQHAPDGKSTNRKRRAKVRQCELMHYHPNDETYSVRVKVSGTKKQDYRLPYPQLRALWREYGEGDLRDAVTELLNAVKHERRTIDPVATEQPPSRPVVDRETQYHQRMAGF